MNVPTLAVSPLARDWGVFHFPSKAPVLAVMAITKCLIWVPPVNHFTVTATALSQRGRTSDGLPSLALRSLGHEAEAEVHHAEEPLPRLRSRGASSAVPRIGCVWIVRPHLNRIHGRIKT